MLNHLLFLGGFFLFFSKVRVGAKEGGSHYWEMAVAITCGYGGYLLPLLAAHSSYYCYYYCYYYYYYHYYYNHCYYYYFSSFHCFCTMHPVWLELHPVKLESMISVSCVSVPLADLIGDNQAKFSLELNRWVSFSMLLYQTIYGSGHGTVAVLLPGFAINW